MVRPSTSRTKVWESEASAANSSTTHSRAARMSVRSPSRPTAKLTAVSVAAANSSAELSP